MLGYKKILPINVLVFFCVFMFGFMFTPWWAKYVAESLPDHLETAAFYYIVASGLIFWNVGRLACKLCECNRRRYNEQYEMEVNNFIFHFTPMIYAKLNRHAQFEEFNNLLRMAIGQAKQLIEITDKERPNGP